MNVRQIFIQRVRRKAEELKMTPVGLIGVAGFDRQNWRNWTKGKHQPTATSMQRVYDAFDRIKPPSHRSRQAKNKNTPDREKDQVTPIDSEKGKKQLNKHLCDRAEKILPQWMPEGRMGGPQWIYAKENRVIQVTVHNGKWADINDRECRGSNLISLYATLNDITEKQAAEKLAKQTDFDANTGYQETVKTVKTSNPTKPPHEWSGRIEEYLKTRRVKGATVTTADMAMEVLGYEPEEVDKGVCIRVGVAMRRVKGWELRYRRKESKLGNSVRVYVPVDEQGVAF